MSPLRKTASALAALCLAGLGVTAVSSTASAATSSAGVLDATCPLGTETTTYDPPVTLTPTTTDIDITTQLGPCVTTDPAITTGTINTSFTAVRSCVTIGSANNTTLKVTWNDGRSSTINVNFVVNTVGGQVVSTGTGAVLSGPFSGDSAVIVVTGPVLNPLECLTGVHARTGTFTMELTSL
ncbi:hypothetical protein [Streptomyces sp. NPDC002644]